MQETRNNRKILAQPFVRAKIDKNDYHKIAAMYSPEFIIFFFEMPVSGASCGTKQVVHYFFT